jgi:hypothetical protein
MLMRSSWLAPKAGVGCARFFQIPNLHLVVCGVIHDRRGVRYRPSGPAPSLWLCFEVAKSLCATRLDFFRKFTTCELGICGLSLPPRAANTGIDVGRY